MKMNVICSTSESICFARARINRCLVCSAYLHAILQLCNYWALGYEGEDLSLHGEGHWDDEAHEDHHLDDEEEEDL